tara:strand:- start:531 stop:965 length:435 start_codon:yes stop_codon:yes gene_type:complete
METAPEHRAFDVGFVTRNAEPMQRFYQDVLGLQHVATIPLGPDTLIKLAYGRSSLKLYVPATPPTPSADPEQWASRAGIRYVTVPVDDARATLERCRKAGAPIYSEIVELPADRRAAIVGDPDGNAIELFEDPASMVRSIEERP